MDFKKIKEYLANSDGSHTLVSKFTDASTVNMNDDGLTLAESKVFLTQDEYDALETKNPNVEYWITDGVVEGTKMKASDVTYDNTETSMDVTNMQDAVDKLDENMGGLKFSVTDGILSITYDDEEE